MYTPTHQIIPANVSNNDAININTKSKRKHRHLGWHGAARAAWEPLDKELEYFKLIGWQNILGQCTALNACNWVML